MNEGLTKKQNELLDELESVIRKCEKAGISLFGLQNNIVAYNGKALAKALEEKRVLEGGDGSGPEFPDRCLRGALVDSGADDPYRYRNYEISRI